MPGAGIAGVDGRKVSLTIRCYARFMVYGGRTGSVGSAALLLVLVAGGCAGGGGELRRLRTIAAELERAPAPVDPAVPLGFDELAARARAVATGPRRAEIEAIAGLTAIDDRAGGAVPTVSLAAQAGRSGIVRRTDEAGRFNLLPSVDWNVVRVFQRRRIAAMRGSGAEAGRLRGALAGDAVEAETARRFAAFLHARERLGLVEERLALRRRETALTAPERLDETDAAAAAELAAARGAAAVARRELEWWCDLPEGAAIVAGFSPDATGDRGPLGDYVADVMRANAALGAADATVTLREGQVRGERAERWSGLSAGSGLGDLLHLLNASPLMLVGYSVQLLDGGAQRRREARAEADLLLARLEKRDELGRLAAEGGRCWLRSVEDAAAVAAGARDLARAERDAAVARAQYEAGAIPPAGYFAAEQALVELKMQLAERRARAFLTGRERRLLARDHGASVA